MLLAAVVSLFAALTMDDSFAYYSLDDILADAEVSMRTDSESEETESSALRSNNPSREANGG